MPVSGDRAGRGCPIGRLYIDRGEDDIRITDIALLPQFRGRGIGRMLIGECILAEGRGTGKRVTIYVEHYNPSAPFLRLTRLPPRRHERRLPPDGVVGRAGVRRLVG